MDWIHERLSSLSKLSGYQKPDEYVGFLKLDTNENLIIKKTFLQDMAIQAIAQTDLRSYPPQESFDELMTNLSRYLHVPKRSVTVGNGADQIIDLILSTFGEPGLPLITIKPTFSIYFERGRLHGLKIIEVPLENDLSIDSEKFLRKAEGTKIACITSPNNPTGNQFDKKTIVEIISNYDGLIVIDEAYVEFADYSLSEYVRRFDNLIILRTMSKAFGLANARIGYMIANENLINTFSKIIQLPYALSGLSMKIASIAFSKIDYILGIVEEIKKEREHLFNLLSSIQNVKPFKSDSNFILFNVEKDSEAVYKKLVREKILVRKIGSVGIFQNCFRVTVGTKQMNEKFAKALEKSLN